jgi:regulator-associated protein of mTOR
VLRQYDCTPTSYPVLPSTHLHPLWQVWDTTVDDFLCQFPLAEALPGHSHVYRQPKLLAEQLLAFSAQLTLFAESCESDDGRKKAAKLCADTLPMIFFAAAGGSYRLLALTLLVVSALARFLCSCLISRLP